MIALALTNQASFKIFYICKRRSEKNLPAEKMECNRWPDADWGEELLTEICGKIFVPMSDTWHSHKLTSPVANAFVGRLAWAIDSPCKNLIYDPNSEPSRKHNYCSLQYIMIH